MCHSSPNEIAVLECRNPGYQNKFTGIDSSEREIWVFLECDARTNLSPKQAKHLSLWLYWCCERW
jgi:hypothetical protein